MGSPIVFEIMDMDIEVLSPEVVNQIAAGEVVERPSHLVKELVENSLDAGATEIAVEFAFGGKQVRIKDNGCGISKEDLPLALARHATSKIRQFPDIWSLNSYGFRGEALASISAVSKVTLTSRPAKQEVAYQLNSDFGKFEEPLALGGETGTTVTIGDLFANVPARLKFLKSDAAEFTQIKNVLKAMAMAYPHVNFRIHQNGKLLFYWPSCKKRKSRVEQVLEQETMYAGSAEVKGLRAEVVISSPNHTVGTKRQIWMYAQNRWVQDGGIQAAIMDAYRNLLMHGEYPIAVAWVSCAPDEIDVNIHPTKSQVKFRQPSDSFRVVSRAVRGCLERAPWVEDLIPQKKPKNADYQQQSMEGDEAFHRTQFPQKSFDWGGKVGSVKDLSRGGIPIEEKPLDKGLESVSNPHVGFHEDDLPNFLKNNLPLDSENLSSGQRASKSSGREPEALGTGTSGVESPKEAYLQSGERPVPPSWEKPLPSESINEGTNGSTGEFTGSSTSQSILDSNRSVREGSLTHWSRLQVLGQADLTYIVTQSDHSLLFVDQHAAHERVVFEKLMKSWKEGNIEVQQLLIPEVFRFSEDWVQAIFEVKEELSQMGLFIDQMGPEEVSVNSLPTIIKQGSLSSTFEKLAMERMEKGGSFVFEKYVGDLLATMACHSVIRASQPLSREEMESLLVQMDEFPLSSFCPHGRPVYVEYRFSKLERDFGRIS